MEPNRPVGRGVIALAVYRPDPALLTTQLRTVQSQTLREWACHIGIDGRDDTTAALVSALTEGDSRFVVHHFATNVGFYRNFERLLRLTTANAEWVALSDQDDAWDCTKLERLAGILTDRSVMAAMCQARVVDAQGVATGRTDRHPVPAESLVWDNQVTGSLAVFAVDVVRRALPFPSPTPAAYHDHWMGLVARCLGDVVVVDEALQDYVQHGANVLGERAGGTRRARVHALFRAGPASGVRVLATQRWAWRRTMAMTIRARVPELGDGVLGDLADGRLSWRLLLAMASAVIHDHASPTRVAALLIGGIGDRWMAGKPA